MFLCQLKTNLLFILLFPSISQSGSNALHCAALNGHAGVIRVLVPMKCNPNQQRKDGWTPLHLGCWNGHQDVVHELIICKSQVNSRTNVSEIFSAVCIWSTFGVTYTAKHQYWNMYDHSSFHPHAGRDGCPSPCCCKGL